MPTILPAMGLTLPVRGTAGAGQWADAIDADLTKLDAHNHAAGKGNPVPTAGIAIDADLTFSGTWAPKNLHRIQFSSVAALSDNAQNLSLFVSTDHELYYRNFTGNNVKLTLGTALNVAAFVGGIGGDYTAVGAALNFDDSQDRYTLRQQGGVWARMASGEVRIFETATTENGYVGLACPAALSTQYTITLPLAAPVATAIVQMDSGANIIVSNTVSQPATFSGLITASAGVTAGGLVTANAGVTAAVNQDVSISGTANYNHGVKTIASSLIANMCNGASGTVGGTAGAPGITLGNNTIVYVPLPPLPIHCRVVNVSVYFNSATDRTNCTSLLYQTSAADPAAAAFTSTGFTLTNSGTAISKASSVNLTPSGTRTFWVQISNGISTPNVQGVSVDYDVP